MKEKRKIIKNKENLKLIVGGKKSNLKKEEHQLFLESNNSPKMFRRFHIRSFLYKLDISLLLKRMMKKEKREKRKREKKKKMKKKDFEEERVF